MSNSSIYVLMRHKFGSGGHDTSGISSSYSRLIGIRKVTQGSLFLLGVVNIWLVECLRLYPHVSAFHLMNKMALFTAPP